MVEVSPKGGEIQISLGWLFFAVVAIVVFAAAFYFVPNTGWYWYALTAGIVVAAIVDGWYFRAPMPFLVVVLVSALTYALVWKYYLSVAH